MADAPNRWPGLLADVDPLGNPGAQIQDNCGAETLGRLAGRKGVREVFFRNATSRGAIATLTDLDDVLAVASFVRPAGEVVVWLEADGTVRYGKDVT